MHNKTIAAAALLAAFGAAHAQTLGANYDYVIEDQNGYTYNDTTNFMNFGHVSTYYSFAVLDFNAASLGSVASVNSATLTLQESDYSSTKPFADPLTVWAVTDNTTNLHKGQAAVQFDDSVVGGYSGQLGTAVELGTFSFTSTSSGNSSGVTNQDDVINLTSGLAALASQINSSAQTIRILITTDEYPGNTNTGYATFAGAGASSAGVQTKYDPQLALSVTPAPEPASMAALGLGIAGLVARRRRR